MLDNNVLKNKKKKKKKRLPQQPVPQEEKYEVSSPY